MILGLSTSNYGLTSKTTLPTSLPKLIMYLNLSALGGLDRCPTMQRHQIYHSSLMEADFSRSHHLRVCLGASQGPLYQ